MSLVFEAAEGVIHTETKLWLDSTNKPYTKCYVNLVLIVELDA